MKQVHDAAFRKIGTQTWLFQGLMRELELREKKVNDIQALGDKLVREGHPGKKTVEVRALLKVCMRSLF